MKSKKRIAACVVLYNPDNEVLINISNYNSKMEKVVVVDNSDVKGVINYQIENLDNLHYIDMQGNKGIAAALNVGLNYLYNAKYDIALTMDQDSVFPMDYFDEIYRLVQKYSEEYSIVGLNINHESENKTDEIVEVSYLLTSGNFVNLLDFYEVGEFCEDLFIDYVDFEFDFKLCKANKKICYLKDYSLKHKIGNPIEFEILGRKYYAMNHHAVRYYYRYRNAYYLNKMYGCHFKKLLLKEIIIQFPKMLIFEKDRLSKIKMISKGIKDAKSGKLGAILLK